MGKPTICMGENKDADQLRSNWIGHVRKPPCWFSHEAAQMIKISIGYVIRNSVSFNAYLNVLPIIAKIVI